MKINNKIIHSKVLYIFFTFLSLILFFFSTVNLNAKAFNINNIEISKPFEIKFDKNEVINDGFKRAFLELISLIVKSSDHIKVDSVKLNEIKGMIESFTIKEEKFIDNAYHVSLGVSFNKKKIFSFLEKKNIFPSALIKKKFLFIPIIIDEKEDDLLIFSKNKIFENWNNSIETFHLIDYILLTEDLEDINLIKSKYEFIEEYDFKEITDKYFLNDSIIALFFKSKNDVRVLSRIKIKDDINIKNQSFSNIDLNDNEQSTKIVNDLKIIYEDYWKNINQINTSIKLPISIKASNFDNSKIINFENVLDKTDLIYNYTISKFDRDFIYYQIIFNGAPNTFLKTMAENGLFFNTQNKTWSLK